jgi:hypothetical protein
MPGNTSPQRTALWVKPREAAQMLGLSYETVLWLAKKHKIPAKTYTIRGRDRYLIPVSWLLSQGSTQA